VIQARIALIAENALSGVPALVSNCGQELLNLGFLLAIEGQEGQARWSAVVAIEVHRKFHARHTEFGNDALGGEFHSLLLLAGESGVAFLEGGIDFVARGGRGTGESEDGAYGAESQRRFELVSRSDHDLEADFFLAGLEGADDGDCGGGWGRGASLRRTGGGARPHVAAGGF